VLLAVIVGEVERNQAWVASQGLEEMHGALRANMIATDVQMNDGLVVVADHLCQYSESFVREIILAKVNLRKRETSLQDLRNYSQT